MALTMSGIRRLIAYLGTRQETAKSARLSWRAQPILRTVQYQTDAATSLDAATARQLEYNTMEA